MCGIFGFASKKNNKKFAVDKFTILGLYNDSRGKDSCGVFIDKEIQWGVDKSKLYADFVCANPFVSSYEDKHVDIAMGHCRKASVGSISLETAQPVIIRGEDDKIEFVFTHNGTLINHQELAKKYLSKFPEHFTDSQILAWIIYFVGPKVLSEYNGAGAFAWTDYRGKKPRTYLFKGASPSYQNYTVEIEERPLFLIHTPNGIWWSSMKAPLDIICYSGSELVDLHANTLFCIEEGEIIDSTIYSRKNNYQNKSNYYSRTGYAYNASPQVKKDSILWKYQTTGTFSKEDYSNTESTVSRLYFKDGLYYINKDLADGVYYAWMTGYTTNSPYGAAKPYYFFKGRMLSSLYALKLAQRMRDTLKETEEWKDSWISSLCYKNIYYDVKLKKFYEVSPYSNLLTAYKGSIDVFFTDTPVVYVVHKGKITGRRYAETRYSAWNPTDDYKPEEDMDFYVIPGENLSQEDINILLDSEIEDIKKQS